MWFIIGLVVLIAVVAVVLSRRGSTGASRPDDLSSRQERDGTGGTGYVSGDGGGMGAF